MDKAPLISLIFYSIPESFLIFSFGLALQQKNFKFRPIIFSTLISVSASYLARLLPLPYGFHTLIGAFMIFLLFYLVFKLNIKQSLSSALISLSVLIALENVILNLIQVRLNLSLEEVMALPAWHRTVIGWPHLVVWGLLTLLTFKRISTHSSTR